MSSEADDLQFLLLANQPEEPPPVDKAPSALSKVRPYHHCNACKQEVIIVAGVDEEGVEQRVYFCVICQKQDVSASAELPYWVRPPTH